MSAAAAEIKATEIKRAAESTKTIVESKTNAESLEAIKMFEVTLPRKTLDSIDYIICTNSSKVAIEQLIVLLKQSEQDEDEQNKQNSLHIAYAILVFSVNRNYIDIAKFIFEYKHLDDFINHSFIIFDETHFNQDPINPNNTPNMQPRRVYQPCFVFSNPVYTNYHDSGFKDLSKVFNVSPHFNAILFPTTLLGMASFHGHFEMVRFLHVEKHADVHVRSIFRISPIEEVFFAYDMYYRCAPGEHLNVAKYLLNNGADWRAVHTLYKKIEAGLNPELREDRERFLTEIETFYLTRLEGYNKEQSAILSEIDAVFLKHSAKTQDPYAVTAPFKGIIMDFVHSKPPIPPATDSWFTQFTNALNRLSCRKKVALSIGLPFVLAPLIRQSFILGEMLTGKSVEKIPQSVKAAVVGGPALTFLFSYVVVGCRRRTAMAEARKTLMASPESTSSDNPGVGRAKMKTD